MKKNKKFKKEKLTSVFCQYFCPGGKNKDLSKHMITCPVRTQPGVFMAK